MRCAPKLAPLLALVACAVFAGGCLWSYGRFDPLSRGDEFDDARKHFTRAIRWGQLDLASRWVASEERADFLAEARGLAGWRFTDYEIESIDVDDAFETGTVEVLFQGYQTASLVERSVRITQAWKRDPDSGWSVSPRFEGLPDAARAP